MAKQPMEYNIEFIPGFNNSTDQSLIVKLNL